MTTDPRTKNQIFSTKNIYLYLQEYVDELQAVLSDIPQNELEDVIGLLESTIEKGGKVLVAGNGGSSAIAEHLTCDWTKGTHQHGKPSLQTYSLASNTALMTAISNDFGYDESFSYQLELYGKPNDVLLLISSSGNSKNIVSALEKAKAMGLKVIGFTGFDGGVLKKGADHCLHVPANNYGVVEDAHQVLMHTIAQYLDSKRGNPPR